MSKLFRSKHCTSKKYRGKQFVGTEESAVEILKWINCVLPPTIATGTIVKDLGTQVCEINKPDPPFAKFTVVIDGYYEMGLANGDWVLRDQDNETYVRGDGRYMMDYLEEVI